jgi:hypothetical protein
MGPAGFKSEGEHLSPIAIPYAPAHGSGDGGIGPLFALDPDAKGGGVNLRPEFPKNVWCYDFMQDCTHNDVSYRILYGLDEYTRECLALKVA